MNSIKQLTEPELDEAFSVVQEAIEGMKKAGIDQWDEIYPDKKVILEDITSNCLYGYIEDGTVAAIIVLNEIQDQVYKTANWKIVTGSNLVIHRLCVSPKFQNKGIAKKLVLFAEELAAQKKYSSIRLDAFSKNSSAIHLYEKLGYSFCGQVNFRKGIFFLYEKMISVDFVR